MVKSKEEIITEIYTNPSNLASYGSIKNLYNAAKIINNDITRKDVRKF